MNMMITSKTWDSARWPNFTPEELRCKHTGQLAMDPDFLDKLQLLRFQLGVPIVPTSGYRHSSHPEERSKARPGTHNMGKAIDFAADGQLQFRVLEVASVIGFKGIGLARTWMHLDTFDGGPRPNVWIYC